MTIYVNLPSIFGMSEVFFNGASKLIFRHASVSGTYPCKLVGQSVSWSVTLSDFQSLVSNGRSNKKSSKNKVHLFSNFASGRTSYTFLWVGRVLPEAKFENRWTLFFNFFYLSDRY